MALDIEANEANAARRRVYFQLTDAADGMNPELAEEDGQPQISTNGGAWTNTGIGTLVHIGNGRYYATLTQASVAAPCVIESRYKSVNTAEGIGTTVQVKAPSGVGENTVTIEVDDGTDVLQGAVVSIRATSGGASLLRPTTDTAGQVTVNLDDGTYYMQAGLRGYVHVEEAVVISANPQAITLSMSGLSVEAPADPDLVRLYLVQRTAEGEFAAGRPFTLRLNTECLDSAGELVPDSIVSTDKEGEGYAYADVYPTTALTRVDGKSLETYPITYRVKTTLHGVGEIEVEATPAVQDLSELLHPPAP